MGVCWLSSHERVRRRGEARRDEARRGEARSQGVRLSGSRRRIGEEWGRCKTAMSTMLPASRGYGKENGGLSAKRLFTARRVD